MAAVKLGLPADHNNYDAAALLQIGKLDKVVKAIGENDDWGEMVMRKLPKLVGRGGDPERFERILVANAGIDIRK